MKPEMYDYFVLVENQNPVYSFTGYTDNESGVLMQFFDGRKEKIGNEYVDVPKRFRFTEAHRSMRVRKNSKSLKPTAVGYDKDGKEILKYLLESEVIRRYPECKGSPNGSGKWMFMEVKEEEDAKVAVDAKKIQLEALNSAMNLEDGEIKEMAALYGQFDSSVSVMKHYLLEKAGAEPATFLGFFKAPERSSKALLKKAISLGVVKVQGSIHNWGNETLGHDENAAIAKIIGNEDIAKALRDNVKGKR